MTKQEIEKKEQIDAWIKDDIEQAIKRGGQKYADAYTEGLYDAYNNPLPDLEALERNEAEQTNSKQTAVEWLEHIYLTSGIDRNVHFSQAKKMEQEQLRQQLVSGKLEAIRTNFCLWYYAQSQPLDAHKVVDWFVSNLR